MNHVIKVVIYYLQRCKTSLNEGEQQDCKHSDKTLRYNFSLKLDQIVKLIHRDKNIQQ